MAEPPITPGGMDWEAEQWRALLRTLNDKFSAEEIWSAFQMLVGTTHGTFWVSRDAKHKVMMAEFKQFFQDAANLAGAGAAEVVNSVFGIPISAGDISAVASGGSTDATRKAAGDAIVKLIFSVFDINAVRDGYENRLPGGAEADNFGRFVGINWQLQIADLIAGFVKDAVPWGLADGIQEVGEALQKILGLEDAQEEILEPFMEKLIVEGINKQFNRETKPTDYTPSDAIGLFIRGWISEQEMHAVLDNEGIRQANRKNLVDLASKRPSQGDVQDLYNHGIASSADLDNYFRGQGYPQDSTILKRDLVVKDRLWSLWKQQEDVVEQQAVKNIIPEIEYENFLRAHVYSEEEISVLIDMVRRKKTLAAKTTARRITGSFNITPERVKEGASAIIKWNIRNADTITIAGLGTVGARGEQPLAVPRSQTYTLTASNDAGEQEEFYAYVEVRGQPEVKLPRVTLSLSPRSGQIASVRELRWNVSGADTITIDGVPVAAQGVQFVTPFLPTFYTLRATNVAGTATTQDVALIDLPDDFLDPAKKPVVSFAITPLVVSATQPQIEIKWGTTNSESQLLEFPDGQSMSINANGVLIATVAASGVFTLKAKNAAGQTWRQEAVIFKAAAPEGEPPPPEGFPPTLSLMAFPQTVAPGATVTVSWFITGAPAGEFIGLTGGIEIVGQTGNKAVIMPMTPGTYTLQLRATNTGGEAHAELPIVVSA